MKNLNEKNEEYKTAMVQQAPENQEQPPVGEVVELKEEFDLARTVGKVVLIALGVVALGAVGLLVAGAVSKKKDEPDVIDDDDAEDEEKDTDDSDDIANKVVELLEANGVEFKEKTEF